MEWAQILTMAVGWMAIVGPIAGMFLWGRSESRADLFAFKSEVTAFAKEMRSMNVDFKKEMYAMNISFTKEMSDLRAESQAEMKDFHGRLCTIEERNKKGEK